MAFNGLCKREERSISGGNESTSEVRKRYIDEWFFFCFVLEPRASKIGLRFSDGFLVWFLGSLIAVFLTR